MGYLGQGDETTYRANFRMTKAQLKGIIEGLGSTLQGSGTGTSAADTVT